MESRTYSRDAHLSEEGANERTLNQQLLYAEGLCEVVVGAQVQGLQLGVHLPFGADHHYGHSRDLTNPSHQLDPIDPRQQDVEDHQVRLRLGQLLQRQAAAVEEHGFVASDLQIRGHQPQDTRVIVHHENLFRFQRPPPLNTISIAASNS